MTFFSVLHCPNRTTGREANLSGAITKLFSMYSENNTHYEPHTSLCFLGDLKGFTKGKVGLNNHILFYHQMAGSGDNGRAVGVIYRYFNKTFDTVAHSILVAEPGENTQLASSTARFEG